MASVVKEIGNYSEDAINMAFNALTDVERRQTEDALSKMKAQLPLHKKSQKDGTFVRNSADNLFTHRVEPKLREAAARADDHEICAPTVNLELLEEDVKGMDITTLIQHNKRLALAEAALETISLLIKFKRGCTFESAIQKYYNPAEGELKIWVRRQFGIPYDTMKRYRSFSRLIKAFPRLLVSSLHFSEICMQKKRILSLFETDQALAAQYCVPCTYTIKKGLSITVEVDEEVVDNDNGPIPAHPNQRFLDEENEGQI